MSFKEFWILADSQIDFFLSLILAFIQVGKICLQFSIVDHFKRVM